MISFSKDVFENNKANLGQPAQDNGKDFFSGFEDSKNGAANADLNIAEDFFSHKDNISALAIQPEPIVELKKTLSQRTGSPLNKLNLKNSQPSQHSSQVQPRTKNNDPISVLQHQQLSKTEQYAQSSLQLRPPSLYQHPLQTSDFFGHPIVPSQVQADDPPQQNDPDPAVNLSLRSDQLNLDTEPDGFFISQPEADTPRPTHQNITLLSENNRLKQENNFLQQQARVLEEQLSSVVHKAREDADRETITHALSTVQKDLERETYEREMIEQKYKALYGRWRHKELEDQQRSHLFDPK